MLTSYFFLKIYSAVAEKKKKMFQPIRYQVAIFVGVLTRKHTTWQRTSSIWLLSGTYIGPCSYQVSSNCVKRLQRRIRKLLGQSETRAKVKGKPLRSLADGLEKKANLANDVKYLLPVKFCQNLFRG